MSPDFEIEKPFWPRVPKRRGSPVVLAVRKSSADSRVFVMWVSCGARPKSQERRSVVRIQQLASLAPIDLNYIDQGARDRNRQRLGSKLAGPARKAGCATVSAALRYFNRTRTFPVWIIAAASVAVVLIRKTLRENYSPSTYTGKEFPARSGQTRRLRGAHSSERRSFWNLDQDPSKIMATVLDTLPLDGG